MKQTIIYILIFTIIIAWYAWLEAVPTIKGAQEVPQTYASPIAILETK